MVICRRDMVPVLPLPDLPFRNWGLGGSRVVSEKSDLEDKESFRWANAAIKTAAVLPSDVRKTMVGDRESDIYTVMCRTLEKGCDYLFRSVHDRCVGDGGYGLEEYMLSLPVAHTYDLELLGHKGRKARTASSIL